MRHLAPQGRAGRRRRGAKVAFVIEDDGPSQCAVAVVFAADVRAFLRRGADVERVAALPGGVETLGIDSADIDGFPAERFAKACLRRTQVVSVAIDDRSADLA